MSWFLGGGSSPSKEPSRAAEWSTLLSTDASGRLSLGEPALAKLEAMDEPVALVAFATYRKRGEASARHFVEGLLSPRADDACPAPGGDDARAGAPAVALCSLSFERAAHSDAVDDAAHAAAAHKGAHRTLFVDASAVLLAAAQNAPGARALLAATLLASSSLVFEAPGAGRDAAAADAALLAFTALEELVSLVVVNAGDRADEKNHEKLFEHMPGLLWALDATPADASAGDGGEKRKPPSARQALEKVFANESGFSDEVARRNHARMLAQSVFKRRDGAWLCGAADARRACLRKVLSPRARARPSSRGRR